ncbi:DegT/DnrJ/EryC1/StrS family aminotransferase [Micromonospora lutea]|uniref:Aminotransferase DegT n=1 Tax=Micromonospora lutea TaxID=419825 RepID=A0ABQ4J1X8_9ACTN|nr:DegT/DnrJ/EryC1/StrS family aminotransferase [Micromonospora lutea]GIJ24018.1 aminotransferase DegT [Micromonospora lutea]
MSAPTTTSTTAVPFFSGAASIRRDWAGLAARLRTVTDTGQFTFAAVGEDLERAIAERTGAQHTVAVNNGTDALIIMLRAAGIGPGDEVIVPAYTFFASASSVLHVGARPVLVDIQPGSYALDPERVRAAVTNRTRAIMPVHLFTQMADMVALGEVADEHGLQLLEDSAEGIGMHIDGRHAGRWGRAGVLSFFPTKTLGALGDAGMLLTDDEDLARTARQLRCHGQPSDGSYEYLELGYNSRCDEVQAAFLLWRLETLDAEIARRAEVAARYDQRLGELAPLVRTPWLAPAGEQSNLVYYVYLIECERRDELVAYLTSHGVGTEVYYPRPLTEQPCLTTRAGVDQPVPVAKAASQRAVGLPMYPDLTDEQVDRVCDLIHEFYRERP